MSNYPFHLAASLVSGKKSFMYIGENNRQAGWADSLVEAWDSGRAFCCDMRPAIIPVDIDAGQLDYLDEFRTLIEASGHAFVEVASSGLASPNRHFYVEVEDADTREAFCEALRGICGAMPVRVGQKMRPPGTPHRSGLAISEPVDPAQVDRFLAGHMVTA